MMRPLLVVALAVSCGSVSAEEGWVELFNGQDLTGWKINENGKGQFKVEDGAIVVRGERAHLFYTEREFKDFVFEGEVKTTPGSNSGIYFHTEYQEESWPITGHEVQVNVSFKGDPVRSGSLYNRVKLFKTAMKDNEWAKYRITVKGNTVRTEINDEVLYEYVQPPLAPPTPGQMDPRIGHGLFALQAHDPGSVVYYRNLRVKPLDEKAN